MERKARQLSRGYAALFASIAIWSMPSLFQFYLVRYYGPFAQNFYRYSVACLAITPFVFYRVRRGGPKIDLRALGLIWFQSNGQEPALSASRMGRHIAWPGLLIAFTATFCWALYAVLVKRPSAQLGAIRSFGVISFITSALSFPLTLLFGRIDAPLHAGAHVNLILIVSAITCITMAHVLYYVAIQEVGVALAQTLQLLCPLGALALSAWIFHERLTSAQLISAAILLIGAFLAMRTKPAAVVETAENI